MSNMAVVTLNDRLAVASKKFTKACEQIKHLKQQIAVYISIFANYNETIQNDFTQNASREMVRQKIETLQNFKTIFFKYAHQKAEEITKIQVELYGDEAVQEAYQNSSSEEPAYTSVTTNDLTTNSESIADHPETEDGSSTNFWNDNYEYDPSSEFDFTNNNDEQIGATPQLQLIEYDFLTA